MNAAGALLLIWVLVAVGLVAIVGLTLTVLHLLSARAHLQDVPPVDHAHEAGHPPGRHLARDDPEGWYPDVWPGDPTDKP